MKTAEEILKEKNVEVISATPETTIVDAIKLMVDNKIGALPVKDNDNFVGIWTERDLIAQILNPGFYPDRAQLKDYMTKILHTCPYDANIYTMLDQFLGRRHRHLLIEKDGKIIGILSQGDVIRASLYEKSKELDELHAKYNWEYYEDWKWKKQQS
jgi:CBS domain-containing protein